MNQAQLVGHIAGEIGLAKKDVDATLKALGVAAQAALKTGDEITLPGIGKLTVKQRAARTGRNPLTGKEMQIAAKKVPHFSAAKALKDAVA